jgi:hypothetical protein
VRCGRQAVVPGELCQRRRGLGCWAVLAGSFGWYRGIRSEGPLLDAGRRLIVAGDDGAHRFDHVVSVTFENRSFDNLSGYLYDPGEAASFEGVTGRDLLEDKNVLRPFEPGPAPTNRRSIPPAHRCRLRPPRRRAAPRWSAALEGPAARAQLLIGIDSAAPGG